MVLVESRAIGIPYAARPDAELATPTALALAQLVPAIFAARHTLIPLACDGQTLTVAMAAPCDAPTLRLLRLITRCHIQPLAATRAQIRAAIMRFYRAAPIC